VFDNETAALIGALSAIGGGVIVAGSNYAINRAQARDARRERLEAVLGELGYVIGRIDHQLRIEPEPSKAETELNDKVKAQAPMLYYSLGRLRRRLLEPELTEMSASMSRALSAVTLAAPRSLLPALITLTELMGEVEHPPDDWWDRWGKARSDYFVQSRQLLDSDDPLRSRLRLRRRHTMPGN
jgi:hypothetical protein